MSSILVDAPSGAQELITIGVGGGYFDSARVLWDDRTDGPLPIITLGGMVKVDAELVFSQSRLDEHIKALIPPPPQSVSMRQARLQLLALGSLATVNGAIATMPEAAQIEWEYATEVERTNPLVPALVQLLGWSESDTDLYFTEAAKL